MLIIYRDQKRNDEIFQRYKQIIENQEISNYTNLSNQDLQKKINKQKIDKIAFHCFINQFNINKTIQQLQSILKNLTYILVDLIFFLEDGDQIVKQKIMNASFQNHKVIDNQPVMYSPNIEITNLIQYIEINDQNQNIKQTQIEIKDKKVALFISNSDFQKNKIFDILQSNQQQIDENAFSIEDWVMVNAPIFNYESEQSEEFIKSYQRLFSVYKDNISILFLIINLERSDISWQSFYQIFRYLIKFQSKIITLIVDDNNDYLQDDPVLVSKIQNLAQVKKYSYISKTYFQNHQQLRELITKFLEQDSHSQDIGINLQDTIFMELTEEEIQQCEEELNSIKNNHNLSQYREEIKKIDQNSSAKGKELEELRRDYALKVEKIQKEENSNQVRKKYLQNLINEIENEKKIKESKKIQIQNDQSTTNKKAQKKQNK